MEQRLAETHVPELGTAPVPEAVTVKWEGRRTRAIGGGWFWDRGISQELGSYDEAEACSAWALRTAQLPWQMMVWKCQMEECFVLVFGEGFGDGNWWHWLKCPKWLLICNWDLTIILVQTWSGFPVKVVPDTQPLGGHMPSAEHRAQHNAWSQVVPRKGQSSSSNSVAWSWVVGMVKGAENARSSIMKKLIVL